jgi:hypothetical protein
MDERRVTPDRRQGRPRLSPDRRRDKGFNFRASKDEMDLLYRIARLQRTTVTEIVRAHLTGVIAASSSLLK